MDVHYQVNFKSDSLKNHKHTGITSIPYNTLKRNSVMQAKLVCVIKCDKNNDDSKQLYEMNINLNINYIQ